MTLVNGAALGNVTHPAVAGGMQWYVDQVLGNGTFGSGGSYNRFYTNSNVIQAGCICALVSQMRTVHAFSALCVVPHQALFTKGVRCCFAAEMT